MKSVSTSLITPPFVSRELLKIGVGIKMIQGSTKTRTRSISEKRGHSRPSMKVTKPQAPGGGSPAKNNGKSKGSSKSTGSSAGSGKDLLSSNLDVSYIYVSCVLNSISASIELISAIIAIF